MNVNMLGIVNIDIVTYGTYNGMTYQIVTTKEKISQEIVGVTYSVNCCGVIHSLEELKSFIDELLVLP